MACFGCILLKINFAKNLQNKSKHPIFDIVKRLLIKQKLNIMANLQTAKATFYKKEITVKSGIIGNFYYCTEYTLFKILSKTRSTCKIQLYYYDRIKTMSYIEAGDPICVMIDFPCIDDNLGK